MQLLDFLKTVITSDKGYFCLSTSNAVDGWKESWYMWPDDLNEIVYKAKQMAASHNVYYTAHLFSQKSSQKQYVLPTRTIQADLDYADVYSAPIPPTILVETSPGRAQSYWILKGGADYALPTEEVERLSRKITYAIPDCDRTGWPLGHRLRLPDTFNHKYPDSPHITILSAATRRIEPSAFDLLPDLDQDELAEDQENTAWVNQDHFELDIPPTELINTLAKENKISARVRAQYNAKSTDRSEALWQLMCELFSAGLGRDIVYHLAYHSDNNKFADRAYGATRDLRKDVLRAELHIHSKGVDVKSSILEIRKDVNAGTTAERLTKISKIVINSLRGTGSFYHTRDGRLFYVHRNIGKPISIPAGGGGSVSEWLSVILTHDYGINSSQSDARYVTAELQAHVKNMPAITEVAALSHYDDTAETLLVHSGNKDVYAITREGIVTLPNGNADVLFNWSGVLEPFRLDARPLPDNQKWYNIMFQSTMETSTNVSQAQGVAIMTVWFMFLLFRNIASTRPILALLGQPGCISGDTCIAIRRGEHSERVYTIAEAYKAFHGRWRKDIPTRIFSLKDDTISRRTIKDIIFSGNKETYTITFTNKVKMRTTLDHRFLTPTGYRTLMQLQTGDAVITQGDNYTGVGRSSWWATRTTIRAHYHPHARMKMVNGYGPYGSILYSRAVLEADMNHMSVDEYIGIMCNNPGLSRTLTVLPEDVVIHHKDENPENDSLDNLEVTNKIDHDRLHGHKNVRNFGAWSGMFETSTTVVESIVYHGMEPTYDIEMEDQDAPNFLIDGVVVHNSGKSACFRKIYRLLYGKMRDLHQVTSADDFDIATSSNPLVVYDNLDTFERWLPDRFAMGTTASEIEKRKLFTDQDTVVLKRTALIGATAHSPKFLREDIADRLLVITFERRPSFQEETTLLGEVSHLRNSLWASILTDVQHILDTPKPRHDEIPSFRIQDFAAIGLWIARGMGLEKPFLEGLQVVKGSQSELVIEEEYMLVSALRAWVDSHESGEFVTAGQLFQQLPIRAVDPLAFQRTYKSGVNLGKKLFVMSHALKSHFNVEWEPDRNTGTRLWKFTKKDTI